MKGDKSSKGGRPLAIGTTEKVQKKKGDGYSQNQTAVALNISIATVKRHWNR